MGNAMKTKQEIEQQFMSEFAALFVRYGADIDAADYYPGYPECGEDIRMVIRIPAMWDDGGNKTREGCEIDLGNSYAPALTIRKGDDCEDCHV